MDPQLEKQARIVHKTNLMQNAIKNLYKWEKDMKENEEKSKLGTKESSNIEVSLLLFWMKISLKFSE